jgi:hypothetical protein
MRNFQEKRTVKHLLTSWPFLGVFGIVLLFFAWQVIGFMGKMAETSKNKNIAEAKVEALTKTKEKLAEDIAALDTEAGKEASIREKFGLAKEGEGLIVVVDDKPVPKAEEQNKGFFGFFKRWFR